MWQVLTPIKGGQLLVSRLEDGAAAAAVTAAPPMPVTLREAQEATHAALELFLRPEKVAGGGANGGDGVVGGAVLVLDSTNGGRAGRTHVRALSAARLVLVVVLRPAGAVEGGHLGAAEDWLLGRVTGRAAHPAFPPDDEPERQRQKVRIALRDTWSQQ